MQNIDNGIIFYVFASLALLSACMVIFANNPVRAVLSLILTFISTAVTWLVMGAEFLALTLVLVYVGAVMVLFLFVVMMLDIDFAMVRSRFTAWLPLGICLVLATVYLFISVISRDAFEPRMYAAVVTNNVVALGNLIFTQYLFQFEVAGVLLLVAVIAAIGLIYRGPRERKLQNIAAQIQTQPQDRVRLVNGD